MITKAVLALLLAFTNWESINTSGASARAVRANNSVVLQIQTNDPGAHLQGLRMKTAGLTKRKNNPRQAVTGYVLDRGIFTAWRFDGSTGPDSLTFGPQGHIISKRSGGVVDFGVDRVQDTFTFTNRIDVERCSQKHGFRCHPLNHLQRVLVKNFGPEDVIDLQGRRYGYRDVRGGLLPDVPGDRLRVELQPHVNKSK
jgi:hypothetical protein